MEQEHFFNCPYCLAEISMLLDLSTKNQNYTEDCEVCCNPIEISFQAENNEVISFEAKILE